MGSVSKYEISDNVVVATTPITVTTIIEKTHVNQTVTPFGAHVRHSPNPSGVIMKLNDDWVFVASSNLNPGDELTLNYRQLPSLLVEQFQKNISQ